MLSLAGYKLDMHHSVSISLNGRHKTPPECNEKI